MTKILAFSSRKQGGKNSSANFLFGCELCSLSLIEYAKIDQQGRLVVPADVDGQIIDGILDVQSYDYSIQQWLRENVWVWIKTYSFADTLKAMCINVLGLSYEQCYGSDEDKNSQTHLKWEDMPGIITDWFAWNVIEQVCANPDVKIDNPLGYHEAGIMTAREVLQYVGTDIFRKMYYDVWVDATIRKILMEGSRLALITDCRFPNEVTGVQNAGGKVIRFTRAPLDDEHKSETALDSDRFDWDMFDAVIDNAEMTIKEQNDKVYPLLRSWDMVPEYENLPETIEGIKS